MDNNQNNRREEETEEIIEKILQHLNNGKTPAEILNLFSADRKELLNEILLTVDLLKKERDKIVPSSELFKQIMDKITSNVTNRVNIRYLYRESEQGRPSLNNNIITKINNLMTINWKIWAPFSVIIVVALILFSSYQFETTVPQTPVAKEITPQAPITTPAQETPVVVTQPATGDINDAVDIILADASGDQALFADTEKDVALVDIDSQIINDFGQFYNENEF